MRSRFVVTLFLIASTAALSGCGPTLFAVRLDRPAHAGDKVRLAASGERHNDLTVLSHGTIVQRRHEDLLARLDAAASVVSVDEAGRAVVSEYAIARFEAGPEGALKPLLTAGQKLTVRRARDKKLTEITVAGVPVDEPIRSALDLVVSLVSPTGADDDEALGTKEPQPLGATWPIRGDVASRSLSRDGLAVTLAGHTTLVRRTQFQSVDCLEFAGEMTGVVNVFPNLPPGAIVRTSRLEAKFHGMKPVRAALPTLLSGESMKLDAVIDVRPPGGDDAQTIEVRVVYREAKEETVTPL